MTAVRGIVSAAGYVPYRRLERAEIARFFGTGGGTGTRSVAGHDEDTTTMAAEAARLALRSCRSAVPDAVWLTTATPAYLDKTNATAVHAALRLGAETPAFDFGGALRSGMGALVSALGASGAVLVLSADQRDGLPTSGDEAAGGDAAAALLVADGTEQAPVLAVPLGTGSATDEFVDRWRTPGDSRSRLWEERFGETRYTALGREAWERALKSAGVGPEQVDRLIVTGMHGRAVRAVGRSLGATGAVLADDLSSTVGQAGAAQPALVLAHLLEALAEEEPARAGAGETGGRVVALVHLADGADAVILATTPQLAAWQPARTVAEQVARAAPLPYAKFLSWRRMVQVEPPRRPEPARVSSSAAWRSEDWKFGFVGSRDRSSGAVHLPPARVSRLGDAVDDMEPLPMAEVTGTVVTCTVDRLVHSPSPPVVFAVVDFDGGGRLPVELTDVDAGDVAAGDRVEMTFRRLYTADGIHDYFWKARPAPVREAPAAPGDGPVASERST